MKLAGLKAVIRRKRYAYKPHKPAHVAENILNREFRKAYQPMTVLLTDVTEFKYGQQSKAYLSAILDYGENKIVAYQLSKANNNALVRDTVRQIKDQLIPSKTLLHSDRGFQYTSHGFKKIRGRKPPHPEHVPSGQMHRQRADGELLGNHQRGDVPPQDLSEF